MGSAPRTKQRRARRAGIVFAPMMTRDDHGTQWDGVRRLRGGCGVANYSHGGRFAGPGSGSQHQLTDAAGFSAYNGQYSRWYGSGIGHTWYDCTTG
jgi:hypothetical protein